MSDGPTKRESVGIDPDVIKILDRVRAEMVDEMRRRLDERHRAGWNELAEAEIETIARIAGVVGRTVAERAVKDAQKLGAERALKGQVPTE